MGDDPAKDGETAPLMMGEAAPLPVATIVFGRPYDDPVLAAKVKKVINVTIAMGALAVLDGLLYLIAFFTYRYTGSGATFPVLYGVSKILFGLIIPLLGYVSAKTGNKCGMCCFTCLTWCGFILCALSIAAAVLIILLIVGLISVRDPRTGRSNALASFALYSPLWYVICSILIYLTEFILFLLAGIWGCALYNHPRMFIVTSVQVPATAPAGGNSLTYQDKVQSS